MTPQRKFDEIIDFLIRHQMTMKTYDRRSLCKWYDRAIQFREEHSDDEYFIENSDEMTGEDTNFDSCLFEDSTSTDKLRSKVPMKTIAARVEKDGDDFVVVLPAEVQVALDVEIGDDVIWIIKKGEITIRQAGAVSEIA